MEMDARAESLTILFFGSCRRWLVRICTKGVVVRIAGPQLENRVCSLYVYTRRFGIEIGGGGLGWCLVYFLTCSSFSTHKSCSCKVD